MSRSSGYTYDPKTGNWTKSTTGNSSSSSNNSSTNSSSGTSSNVNKGNNLTSSNPNKDNSTGEVEKKYNTIELNTLNGTLVFIVTDKTIKIKSGDTLKLNGLGKYLSGDYYVKEVVRQISVNGYSHSATVIKTDFGNSLKVSSTNTTQEETSNVPSSPTADSAKRTYTVKKGDSLWNIAKKYYGDGSQYKKIYDANTNKIANPNLIYVGQVLVIP